MLGRNAQSTQLQKWYDRLAALVVQTRDQIRAIFGQPWRIGIEDGLRTWTYARYRYALFSAAETEDLIVRFNAQGIVVSYSFNTTETGESQRDE